VHLGVKNQKLLLIKKRQIVIVTPEFQSCPNEDLQETSNFSSHLQMDCDLLITTVILLELQKRPLALQLSFHLSQKYTTTCF